MTKKEQHSFVCAVKVVPFPAIHSFICYGVLLLAMVNQFRVEGLSPFTERERNVRHKRHQLIESWETSILYYNQVMTLLKGGIEIESQGGKEKI